MFKVDKVWKLVALIFWIPGSVLACLGYYSDVEKFFMFGMMWLVCTAPFWGFLISIDWIYRTK